jgi:hypothetical protein
MVAGSSKVRGSSSLTVEWCRPSRWVNALLVAVQQIRYGVFVVYVGHRDECTVGQVGLGSVSRR